MHNGKGTFTIKIKYIQRNNHQSFFPVYHSKAEKKQTKNSYQLCRFISIKKNLRVGERVVCVVQL